MSACSCNVSLSNTGKPGCQPIFSVVKNLIAVPLYANDGTKNQIDLTDTLDAAYFSGKVNQADASKRWFPIVDFKNVASEKAESVFEEFEDASKIKIREGVRSMNGLLAKGTPNYLGKLKGYACAEVGFYIVDKDGNLLGSLNEDGFLDPIKIDEASFDAVLVFGTDAAVQKIQVSFDWSLDQLDENLRMLVASTDFAAGVNLLNLEGLLDLNPVTSSITTAGFTVRLNTDFGSPINPITAKGFVLGDFSAAETSPTPGAIALATCVENTTTKGVYAITFSSAQTSGDVIEVTVSKTGYETATFSVTIP